MNLPNSLESRNRPYPSAELFYQPEAGVVLVGGIMAWFAERRRQSAEKKLPALLTDFHDTTVRMGQGKPDHTPFSLESDHQTTINFQRKWGCYFWDRQYLDINGEPKVTEMFNLYHDGKFDYLQIDLQEPILAKNRQVFPEKQVESQDTLITPDIMYERLRSLLDSVRSEVPSGFQQGDLDVEFDWFESQFTDPDE